MSLRGSTNEFPLEVLLKLLEDTRKTGELTLRGGNGEGALGLADGKVVTAMHGDDKPIPALGAVFALDQAEFEFTPWNDAPPANLEGSLEENLKRAEEYKKWLADVRSVIPHDGIRFRLSERAADQGAVTFTADRWRVVMAVNTRPSVTELASNLRIDRDDALTTLAGLVRDSVIETIDEPAPAAPSQQPAPGPPPAAERPASFESPAPAPPVEPEPATPPSEASSTGAPSEDWSAALLRQTIEAQEPEAPAEESAPFESAPPAPPAEPTWSEPSAPAGDAWSSIPTPEPSAPQDATPTTSAPDWTSSPAEPAPQWSPPQTPAPAQDWSAVPTPSLPAEEAPPPMQAPSDWGAPATPSTPQWTPPPVAPAPDDWGSAPAADPAPFVQQSVPETPPLPPSFDAPARPETPARPDPFARTEPAPSAPAPAQDWLPPKEAAPIDDRLAALQGMFDKPAASEPAAQQWTAPAADTWVTPGKPAEDPRLAAMNAPAPQAAPPPAAPEKTNEWTPPASLGAAVQPKKAGGLFGGLFGRKPAQPAAAAPATTGNGGAASRTGLLAAFSNALLSEYTSGMYGKAKVDDHMASLLMRVDEQADPIDRPLPVVDDRLDVQALERVQMAEQQAVPYLATLVATIYGDAEKAFGKDKAKRGYKAAQHQIFGADTSALSGPDLAGKLPKV